MILTYLQKLPNNVGNLGKIIVTTGFEWLPEVQKNAQSGHTDGEMELLHRSELNTRHQTLILFGQAPIVQWIRQHLPSCGARIISRAHHQ